VNDDAETRALAPREAFARAARVPDSRTDLARQALLIAAEEYPGLDVEHQLARLDALAREVAPRLRAERSEPGRVAALNQFLFVEQRFAGNLEHYEDPRNSFLNDVLDRRTGIPITLSLVYTEVARRAGVAAQGIGFPGHFLVKAGGGEEIIVDCFHGSVISRADCQARLTSLLGADARLDPAQHLRVATPRETLVRLLGNLKRIYLRTSDFGRALACCERILLLAPDEPIELRDRGLLFEQLECYAAAAADLSRFLLLAPDDESAPAVRDRLRALLPRARQLH